MDFRRVALIVPYDQEHVLLQNRKKINKPHKVDYGLFGGGIEEGESVEQALRREVKEELSLDIANLKDLEFFKKYDYFNDEQKICRELNIFICKLPKIRKEGVHEGEAEIFTFEEAEKLFISQQDKKIVREILDYISKK